MSLILTEIKNRVGIITLNSEKTLNSLSLPMIEELKKVLDNWKTSDNVACVFLQGAGEKAFCAGGDVRQLYDAIISGRAIDDTSVPQVCFDFFSKEYQLDFDIHTYPKPIVVWGHGIVMGGGIGLMAGASHRVVTERSKLAMPEITIGLFPDVGGTWFLNRMPSVYGLYLGLTGTRLDAADCRFLGLADHYIPSDRKEAVLTALTGTDWNGDADAIVTALLVKAGAGVEMPASQAAEHEGFIRGFEGVQSVEEFAQRLASAEHDEWISAGVKSFEAGSPSSANIIFRQLQQGENYSLEEVFRSELNLACQCCVHPDFAEGVRALLVDKDHSPKWHPATLKEVTANWLNSYFTPLWTKNPLENRVNN